LSASNYLLLLLSGFDLLRRNLWFDGSIAIEEAEKMLQ